MFWLASGMAMSAGVDAEITGSVKDKTGGALVGARIVILTPQRAVVATTSTDQSGNYRVSNLPDGPYLVVAQYPSLAEKQQAVTIADGKPVTLDLVLDVSSLQEDVTVTASPGALGDIGDRDGVPALGRPDDGHHLVLVDELPRGGDRLIGVIRVVLGGEHDLSPFAADRQPALRIHLADGHERRFPVRAA